MKALETIKKYRWRIAIIVVVLMAAGGFAYANRDDLTREAIQDYGKALPAAWFVAAFFVLPLAGFPISVLLVLGGIRFGLAGGMALATGGMIFHHFAAFYIAHGAFRRRVREWLERAGHAIPPIKARNRIWFTALFAAIHGPPYAVKLYLLALTDVPLRIYVWVGAPVYIVFCLVPVGAGSAMMHLDPTWIYVIIVGGTILMALAHWLRKRYGGGRQRAEDARPS